MVPNSKWDHSAGTQNTMGGKILTFSTEIAVYLGNGTIDGPLTRFSRPRPRHLWSRIFQKLGTKLGTKLLVDFQNGGRPPSWILKFSQYLKNSNLRLFLHPHAKFGEDRTIRGRVIVYFRFSKWRSSAILDLVWRHSGRPMTCIWWS